MCSFTPSSAANPRPPISPELAAAFEDMRIAIAIKHNIPIDGLDLVILRGGCFDAEYLHQTEAFDS
jgi:hypothetical protein